MSSVLETRPDDVFDVERIRRLVKLMEEHDLREIDLRQSEQRIRLCRGVEAVYPTPVPVPAAASPVAAAATTVEEVPIEPPETAPAQTDDHLTVIKSPMVGTFYGRANSNAEPFVQVGDVVEPETTICIIEAMKVFNEIPAEVRGKVVAILVDDEEPIDYGRPLFKLDTNAV